MGDDHQFCLRWNNHQATLISVFDTLLEKGVHVDCTLAAEGQTLKAHKVVLSACSPYFESVLGQQYDKHPIIILKDVKFAELRAMMDYMYRGEVNISQEQLGALLKAAESLQIKGLSDSKPPPPPQINSLPDISQTLPCKLGGIRTASPMRDGSREGSISPTRRKRKKRRSSISPTPLLLNNNPPTPPDSHLDQMAKIKLLTPKDEMQQSPSTPIEPPNDSATLEPKGESSGDPRDDPAEDLTLDEGAYSDVEHNGPGTSQSLPDMSAQGYGWHMDRSQDDNISQEGPRDSADFQIDIPVIDLDLEASFLNDSDNENESNNSSGANVEISTKSLATKTDSNVKDSTTLCNPTSIPTDEVADNQKTVKKSEPGYLPYSECQTPDGFKCPKCQRMYNARKNLVRHANLECGREPRYKCPHCSHKNHRRNELKRHIQKRHSDTNPL